MESKLEYLGINLKIVYELLKPFLQDFIKDRAKKLLSRKTSSTFREHVYSLLKTMGEFEELVQKYVNELSNLVKIYDERGFKYYDFISQEERVSRYGRDIVTTCCRLKAILNLLDPDLEIYAEDVYFMSSYSEALEMEILVSVSNELREVYVINKMDFRDLKSQLENAKINLEFIREAIEELRKFIKNNIPLKVE